MEIMGEFASNFSIPVCTKFQQTVLNGRRCYRFDVNEFKHEVDSKKLMSHGLIFLMDYNEDRIGLNMNNNSELSLSNDLGDMQENNDNKQDAMIYIETLGIDNYFKKYSFSM